MRFTSLAAVSVTVGASDVYGESSLRTRDEDIAVNNTNPVAKSFIVEYASVSDCQRVQRE